MRSIEPDNPGLPHLPPTYPVGFLIIAGLLDLVLPLGLLPMPPFSLVQSGIGVVLLVLGLGLDLWGYRTMTAAGTHAEPFKPTRVIVAGGPYRLTRNPMYIGFLIAYCGIALILALEWALLLLPALWFTLDRVVVRREEAYLERKFGMPYTDYLARTRRWL